MRFILRMALGCTLVMSLVATSGCTRRKELWIYTSLPKEVITEMAEPLQAALPGATVKWYQSTSENVGNRLGSELEAGKLKADLVLIGDPFWYLEMKQKGHLLPYDSPAAREVPAQYRDPDNAFAAVRLPVMVLVYNSAQLKPTDLPERWRDLTMPKFDGKVSIASPLDYASTFVVLATLAKAYGWEYFAELRKRGLVAEGPHSSVLTRIETGERPIGVLPLDIAVRAAALNRAIKAIYPADGAIPTPGMIAILKESDHVEQATKAYDWFFSPAAQGAIVRGGAYSPLPKSAAPEGARPWAELQPQLAPWSPAVLGEMLTNRDRTRAKFSEIVLH